MFIFGETTDTLVVSILLVFGKYMLLFRTNKLAVKLYQLVSCLSNKASAFIVLFKYCWFL